MATPDWLAATEQIIGASHPTRSNSKDRCGQTIQSMIEINHTEAGVHDARTTGLVGEIGTFSGNGAARTISLSNSGLTPKKVYVWEAIDTTERVTNGGFPSDTSNWTTYNFGNGLPTIASVAGGQAGNCCELTSNAATGSQMFYQALSGLIIDREYTISYYMKEGTAAPSAGILWGDSIGAGSWVDGPNTAPAAWTQYEATFKATATTMYVQCVTENLTTGNTMLFDTISVAEAMGSEITRIDEMASEKAQLSRYSTNAWATDWIDNFQAGSFDIGAYPCNTNGETNYYCVLGYDTGTVPTGDAGAGSDPTWITSSTANLIIADDSADVDAENVANAVESEIWTEFIEEHTVAGAHSVTLQHERIETIDWAGNDGDDRTISCDIDDLDIHHIEVYKDGDHVYTKSTDMSGDNTKAEDAGAFVANLIQDITTNGEFEVGTGLNASGSTYVAFLIGV
jgi:hypothetical protein